MKFTAEVAESQGSSARQAEAAELGPGRQFGVGLWRLVDYGVMSTSLFAASAADLTIERIRTFAERPEQVESLTLEFKRE
ncbi:hypothetical protein PH213_21420 [Streptomyces sp. SRF1]|uniref:hypothetical protein n=1 Tax=Streptomyces sp. SRF1 TaxID=1549642 RepID=UPI0025AF5500|nr:hypothetical protein [Streptomyces sp. SRF1]MDN3057058.1 hypothetical protein [Streptomyces sp. SRF1]